MGEDIKSEGVSVILLHTPYQSVAVIHHFAVCQPPIKSQKKKKRTERPLGEENGRRGNGLTKREAE